MAAMLTQDVGSESVKCSEQRSFTAGSQNVVNAIPHLYRRFIREGQTYHSKPFVWRLRNQVRDSA
jgi:hypothetical protein